MIGIGSIFMATFWLMAIQLVYFFARSCGVEMPLLRHMYFVTACAVELIFWSVYLYDRELIHSVHMRFPVVLNHMQHTLPLLWFFLSGQSDIRHPKRHVTVFACVLFYLVMLYMRAVFRGSWSYAFIPALGFIPFACTSLAITFFISKLK